jgi:hypothetical protein
MGADLSGPSVAARPRESRERKFVYVVDGVIRGQAALERRLGAADAARLVADFRRVARDIAFKHDAVEDKSPDATLRLIVGLPVAGEDDAGRAIRLGLALVDALDGIGSSVEPELRLAIGIQRGAATVVRKAGDTTFELEPATAGFAAHLARAAQPAEILVGGRVYRSARVDWSFEALPAIELPSDTDGGSGTFRVDDEHTDPGVKRARVYRLRGPKDRSQRVRERRPAAALVGRELELKSLRDAYRDVRVSRRKRLIGIAGDHGVGKRSLVAAFLAGIPPEEAYVLRTATRVGTAMTPFGVIADLTREILGLADGAEPHEISRRLHLAAPMLYRESDDPREVKGALQVIGLLLGVRPGPDDAALDPDERRSRLFDIMLRVEQRLDAGKPLVVVGEDVHWSDQESLDLFAALLKVPTPRPILGIITTRPSRRILEAAAVAGTELVHLDELDADARRKLVLSRFVPAGPGAGADVGPLADQILARAGGNPFFILELLDALAERGVIAEAPGQGGRYRWVKPDAPLQVPTSIEDLLITRIDNLPAPEKQVLLAAAVASPASSRWRATWASSWPGR